jgi:peptidoglycan/LPS O-acetylase OafA/YrhL
MILRQPLHKNFDSLFHKSSSSNLQIDSLDGLRGIAVLFVIFSHMSNSGIHLSPTLNFSGSGKYGVFLFFVLSSFLLTLPMINRESTQFFNKGSWLRYFARRFFRIFPLFSIVLLLNFYFYFTTKVALITPFSFESFLQHIVLIKGESIFWTIPVEFKYYFVLPIVGFAFTLILKRKIILVVAFVTVLICLNIFYLFPPKDSIMNTVSLGPYLPIFLLGSFSAFLHSKITSCGGIKSNFLRIAFELSALGILMIIVILIPCFYSIIIGKTIETFKFHKDFLLFGLLWSSFLLFYLNGNQHISQILSSRFLRFIGIVSFSAYLLHMPVIKIINKMILLNPPIKVVLIIILTLSLSVLSHLIIEKPFIKISIRKPKVNMD